MMTLINSQQTQITGLPADPLEQEWFDAWLERQSPQQVLRWAVDTFSPRLVMTSSFGLNGVTLIHMLQDITRDVPIVFVDTDYHFRETLDTKRRMEASYGITVLTYHPSLSVETQVYRYGSGLPTRQPNLCCTLRKIEPMRRAMAELRPAAVLSGRARYQVSTRWNLPIVEWKQAPLRINPLALWTQQQIESYVSAHKVPCNPLHEQGYPSIGCWPCTRPVRAGEHIRAGRWSGLDKTECGLWTAN